MTHKQFNINVKLGGQAKALKLDRHTGNVDDPKTDPRRRDYHYQARNSILVSSKTFI